MSTKAIGLNIQTIKRLPLYLEYLEQKKKDNIEYISTPAMANDLNYAEITIKKDLNSITSKNGIPKKGHLITDLIKDINSYLGLNLKNKAALVGAGKLGSALIDYDGFKKLNLEIVVAFDNDDFKMGKEENKVKIMDSNKIEDLCKRMQIKIGIITVPSSSAQEVCDRLVSAGVKAIWNFAPIVLKTNKDVVVHNENLSSGLALLLKQINN